MSVCYRFVADTFLWIAMSKKISLERAKRIVKVNDTKLDRYLGYYFGEILLDADPNKPDAECLTDVEKQMLAKYQRIYELFDIGRTDAMIRQFLTKTYGIQERQAYDLVRDAYILYGVTGTADKEGKRRAAINYYMTLSQVAFKDKNYEAAIRAKEKADKLEGLFDVDLEGLDPEDFKKPTKIFFVTDLNVFKKAQKELEGDD
jgi:hypothetical protein